MIDEYLVTVHTDRLYEPEGVGTRWWSGEASIERIELLESDVTPPSMVSTRQPVAFRS